MRRDLIRHVAWLAGLEPDPESEAALVEELGKVVAWFDALPEDPEPDADADWTPPWRPCAAGDPEPPSRASDRLIEQAPERSDGWFVVPAIRPDPTDGE